MESAAMFTYSSTTTRKLITIPAPKVSGISGAARENCVRGVRGGCVGVGLSVGLKSKQSEAGAPHPPLPGPA